MIHCRIHQREILPWILLHWCRLGHSCSDYFCKTQYNNTARMTAGEEPTHKGLSVVVDLLFIVTPIVGVCNCSLSCCTLLYVRSSFAIILMGKRELAALLGLSSWCLLIAVWLFLVVPWVCLQFVIVVFPDHTHIIFQRKIVNIILPIHFNICFGCSKELSH